MMDGFSEEDTLTTDYKASQDIGWSLDNAAPPLTLLRGTKLIRTSARTRRTTSSTAFFFFLDERIPLRDHRYSTSRLPPLVGGAAAVGFTIALRFLQNFALGRVAGNRL